MAALRPANTIGLAPGGIAPEERRLSAAAWSRRETLLATTALALGLALSASGPDHALAACVVTSGAPNVVDCGANTTTANAVNIDAAASPSSHRGQTFIGGGAVTAIIQGGVTMDGAGVAIKGVQPGVDVTMIHGGIVDQTSAGGAGGNGGLRVEADSGLLSYSGNGSVTTNQAATEAISLQNSSGDIAFGSVGTPVTPNYTAADGIALYATTTAGGNIDILLDGGTLTGVSGVGMSSASGNGNVTATLTGGTTIAASNVGVWGTTVNGNVVITSAANVGTSGARGVTGLHGSTSGGTAAVTVTQTGGSIFAATEGISATTGGSGGVIVDQQAGTIDVIGTGINATVSNANGAATVTVAGGGIVASSTGVEATIAHASNSAALTVSVDAAVVGSTYGVRAAHTGRGTILVDGAALIEGGSFAGIQAVNSGTGSAAGTNGVVVRGSGNTTATSGVGIVAVLTNAANASNILVERSGTVTGTAGVAMAINAATAGTGNVTVRNAAGVTSFGGAGIRAASAGGNVEVSGNGAVQGGTIGITATSTGAGTVTVGTGGTVTGLGGHGISTSAVNGNTQITVEHAVSGAGGNGVFATSTGVINLQNAASITGNGAFAGVMLDGGTNNVVQNQLGGAISGQTGVVAQNATGNTGINNAGTITGTGGVAVRFTGGSGNILFMNGAGAALNGTAVGNGTDMLRLGGSGANTFDVAKIGAGFTNLNKTGSSTWTLTGTATTTAAVSVGAGTLLVNGNTASTATTVTAGGTLGGGGTVGNTTIDGGTLSPGNSIGTLSVQGTLTFTTAAAYLVEVSPASADRTNVSGHATLAGTVNASFLPGTYLERTYTILSAGSRTGTFDTLTTTSLPAGFTASLSYTGTEAILNLTAMLGALGNGGLNGNQRAVADTLNGYFNTGGTLPPAFVTVFGLTGTALAHTLSQLSGEVGGGAQQAAFQSTQNFLNLMLDPFVAGRDGGVGGAPLGFAADGQAQMPDEVALAYAKAGLPLKAPPGMYEPRWSVWGAAYGGAAKADGDAAIGSSTTDSRAGGFAAGADYRLWPDTVLGFALAGGGTSWTLANGLGSGRSDTFQAGLYGAHRFGAAYLSAALAYAWHDATTTRSVSLGPETLEGRFRPHVLAARAEAGYRFGWTAWGLTPYAAAQLQSFRAPGYAETATAGAGAFALSYASQTETATRTELGLWADHRQRVNADTELLLRGRAAWAHDFDTSRRVNPTFLALPGASFTVDGASPSPDLALLSAVAELRMRGGISLSAKFDGEFGSRSESYAATGTLRYSW